MNCTVKFVKQKSKGNHTPCIVPPGSNANFLSSIRQIVMSCFLSSLLDFLLSVFYDDTLLIIAGAIIAKNLGIFNYCYFKL
jgi:hypothetical protein